MRLAPGGPANRLEGAIGVHCCEKMTEAGMAPPVSTFGSGRITGVWCTHGGRFPLGVSQSRPSKLGAAGSSPAGRAKYTGALLNQGALPSPSITAPRAETRGPSRRADCQVGRIYSFPMIGPDAIPRLRSLELENVRGFVSLRLDFGDPREAADHPVSSRQRATVVVGRNGTNKSTLLRALALGLASERDASALLATETGSFVRKGAAKARITVHLQYPDGRPLKLEKRLQREDDRSDRVVDSAGPSAEELNLLVCGYGAARGITGTDSGRPYRVSDAVATLFDYRRELLSSELTLRRLSDQLGESRFQVVLSRFARAMGLSGDKPRIDFDPGGGVTISADEVGERIPIEALADGYRVTLNWLVDLYGRALRPDRLTEEGSVACLVLIDEIDQHLHPELQTRVVTELTNLMPDAQYVLTTHSPLVALGAHPDQLIVFERTGQEVKVKDRIPDYRGFSPEDVLTDQRLFATNARNPELVQLMSDYDELVAVPASGRSNEEQASLRKVAQALREAPKATMPKEQLDEARSEIEALLREKK